MAADSDLEALEREFSPPVDSTLVYAIYDDYAGQPDGLEKARVALRALRDSAVEEQLSGEFDPSGSSGGGAGVLRGGSGEEVVNGVSALSLGSESRSGSGSGCSTDDVGSSDSGGSGSSAAGGGYFAQVGKLDTPTKELLLAETFPGLRFELVCFTLKKCGNDFERATDELLNQVYFEDSRAAVPKGIDGYDERHVALTKRKGRNRRKQNRSLMNSIDTNSSSAASDGTLSPTTNRWEEGNRDVGSIAKWTKLPVATASSIYHKNGASLVATIDALLDQDAESRKGEEPDAGLVGKAVDLTAKYPTVNYEQAISIIRITAPSLVSADEVAKSLSFTNRLSRGQLDVLPVYSPVRLPDEDSDPEPSSKTPLPSLDPSATPHTTQSLHAARNTAFTQASSAYRKGKSDRNMRGVAGYYAQIGRDLNANFKAATEIDADALVASQSRPGRLDLHGVTVQSARRIAKTEVNLWWDGLGEARIPGGGRRGVGDGFTVVTGLGRHSEGGKGKLGPAVARALVKEGWKVEVNGGELIVLGKQRGV
ncbi:hypothetical protein BU24DRAFT_80841 [Aaosphaeria arxii CBS 175.79]|uniref:Smr domain-containing protein n=1 Tax=Aaosphaeria arxii CBS 175.79 TaxID=1450172 RepID=A0A6A5X9Q0_9PLEO|nr:uncharacterized protein BU24DRAFT_80841 [Aaosphaeria arxii CBS 175.79]KAF2009681.1 hypothetical protein BU24DRAFT_80841 [Aaosphaeria arxii CBS 175.79]